MADAMVTLEGQFPFNLVPGPGPAGGTAGAGPERRAVRHRALPVLRHPAEPEHARLLGHRRRPALQDPQQREHPGRRPAASVVRPAHRPGHAGQGRRGRARHRQHRQRPQPARRPGPLPLLIQKALEIAGEVRSLGNALLSAFEKGDAEQLALLRQGHEVALQQMIQNVRYLQWQHAVETTNGLLKTRDSASSGTRTTSACSARPRTRRRSRRSRPPRGPPGAHRGQLPGHLRRAGRRVRPGGALSGLPGPAASPGGVALEPGGRDGPGPALPEQAGGRGAEHASARRPGTCGSGRTSPTRSPPPSPRFRARKRTWPGGASAFTRTSSRAHTGSGRRLAAEIAQVIAGWQQDQASIAARTAGYQRRAEEWTLQANLAARELRQIGRQIIASLIAEQVAYHDYTTVKKQVEQATEVQTFLQTKFTSAGFYTWMQSDLSGLYYQYYRFACDTARKAEQTMKQELMRPELDATQFIQYNYWDSGHQGLLSGEALYLDIKRMELAYHDSNKRELELTRHVSLRQLDPLALLALKVTGSCTVTVPEWLYDLDWPRPLPPPHEGPGGLHAVRHRSQHEPEHDRDPAEQHDPRLAAARERRVRPRHHPGRRPLRRLLRLHRRHRDQRRHERQRHVRDQPARRALPAVRGRGRDQHLEPVAARASSGRSTT